MGLSAGTDSDPGPVQAVAEAATLRLGGVTVTAIATAGRNAVYTAWRVRWACGRVLVGGDTICAGGAVVLRDARDCYVPQTCAVIDRPDDLAPE